MRHVLVGVLALALLGACGGDGDSEDTAFTAEPNRDPKWDLTFRDWETAELTASEESFQQFTRLAIGIGTNPPKMLEYGYDLCEKYLTDPGAPRADAIRDFAIENSLPMQTASLLGSNATEYLCPV